MYRTSTAPDITWREFKQRTAELLAKSLTDVLISHGVNMEPIEAQTSSVEATLEQRETIYGNYDNVASTSQYFKDFFKASPNYTQFSPAQRESLDMIANKLARILNGDPTYADSWHDIAGYATLAEKSMLAARGTKT